MEVNKEFWFTIEMYNSKCKNNPRKADIAVNVYAWLWKWNSVMTHPVSSDISRTLHPSMTHQQMKLNSNITTSHEKGYIVRGPV